MKYVLPFVIFPGVAVAHSGHIAETSGHSHWVIPAAFVAVAVIGATYLLKAYKTK